VIAESSPRNVLPHATRTRIVLVDDHPTLLRGVEALLSDDERFEVVGVGGSADEALELAVKHNPDVLVVDLSMPGDVFAAIEQTTQSGRTKVVVFTAYGDVNLAMRALDAGAQGFVLKGRPSDDLSAAIEMVVRGDLFVSPDFSKKLMAGFRHRSKREKDLKAAKLSARERQLVECLLEAKSNKEIARTLNLTEKTIKHYMTNLMNKLRVKSRIEVVLAVQSWQRSQEPATLTPFDEAG
jgi:DNA-binding NarL/FixJ family response regulator